MMYSLNSPYLPYLADNYITGHYGEDRFASAAHCAVCGEMIMNGERYYDIGGQTLCMQCEPYAEQAILDDVRSSYIFEL